MYFLFSIATGISCCGGMCLFGLWRKNVSASASNTAGSAQISSNLHWCLACSSTTVIQHRKCCIFGQLLFYSSVSCLRQESIKFDRIGMNVSLQHISQHIPYMHPIH